LIIQKQLIEKGKYKVHYSHPQNNYTYTVYTYSPYKAKKGVTNTPKHLSETRGDNNSWKRPTPLNSYLGGVYPHLHLYLLAPFNKDDHSKKEDT